MDLSGVYLLSKGYFTAGRINEGFNFILESFSVVLCFDLAVLFLISGLVFNGLFFWPEVG